ncbi:hypothetical protein [Fibrella aquatilis]|nr:hypothetical protein [Fibrella aquatilis]
MKTIAARPQSLVLSVRKVAKLNGQGHGTTKNGGRSMTTIWF